MNTDLKYAWLESEGKLYVASSIQDESKIDSKTEGATVTGTVAVAPGHSPIIKLIEQIYFTESFNFPSQARLRLRERIHYSYPPSITDRETVKVAAKRLATTAEAITNTFDTPSAEFWSPLLGSTRNLKPLPTGEIFTDPELVIGSRINPEEIPATLERLRLSSDRLVSALLIDSEDRILGWSWNTNAVIKTRHAEWNLCEGLGTAKIPSGARLWVSLKPCRMCAARIWESAEDPTQIEVIYLENDPGPFAQGTMLDTDSPARLRYLGTRDPRRSLVIQKQFGT